MRYYKLKLGHVQIHTTRFLSYPANKQSEKDLLAEVMTEVNLCFFLYKSNDSNNQQRQGPGLLD